MFVDAHLPPFVTHGQDAPDHLDQQPVKLGVCPGLQALRGLGQGTQFVFAPGPPSGLIKQ